MGFAFAAPAALLGLLTLPLIYWLLRVTPPRPREIFFPPTRILRELKADAQTPSKTPWWLLALRLALAAALILAMAGPAWSPSSPLATIAAPTLLVLDDGWSAAPTWDRRLAAAGGMLDTAARNGASVAITTVSDSSAPETTDAAQAQQKLRALRPQPFLPDRSAAAAQVTEFVKAHSGARIIWISDGLAQDDDKVFVQALINARAAGAQVETLADDHVALALAAPLNNAKNLTVDVLRASVAGPAQTTILANDGKGRTLGRATIEFGDKLRATATFDLPIEVRNDASLLRIEGENSAGAVALLDSRSTVKRVGLIGGAADETQPLLSPLHYLEKAFGPFAQTRQARAGAVEPALDLLAEHPNVVVLADVSLPPGDSFDALTKFVEEGGTLVRFAGPRLANAADTLLPARLRRNGRVLGGAMSWETPKALADFDATSPFAGLPASKDVSVQRQVLAEPDPGLAAKTWARLDDGTPLVTAERRGKGMIVLFHFNADTSWSNLPISGLFVDMLKRIVDLSASSAPAADAGDADTTQAAITGDAQTFAPQRTLDGFGALDDPSPLAQPIAAGFTGPARAEHPPGFYGAGDMVVAVQPLAATATLTPFDFVAAGQTPQSLQANRIYDFRAPLLALALVAFIADTLLSSMLSGKRGWRGFGAAIGALAIIFVPLPHDSAQAGNDPTAREAALKARLAYVVSGDRQVDDTARAGLEGLSAALAARTSFAPAEPAAIDPAKDELAFYPMLYWPIVAKAPQPSAKAAAKIAAYMKQGGTIIFDTRDALMQRPGDNPTPEGQWLRDFAKNLDLPELEIAPRDHVITKTFYLLDNFVGRYVTGETWVEALPPETKEGGETRPIRATDSVSAIVITSNDLAGAWAQDKNGQPLYPLTPGGMRQREMALRGGVNLVMYTLTGNYKSDQVHVRDLLERLGQ